ncbi:DUF58 domain-containing protein, partial [bacterium]|nr:DUF58 domain-containing protein [bacterium]
KRPRQRFPENVHTELLQGYPKEDLWQLRESYAALPPDGFDEQQVEEQRNAITRELVNRFNDPEVPHHEKVSAITWAINLPGRHASWLLHVEDLVTLLPYDLSEQLELLNIFLNAPLSSHLSEAEQLSLSQRLGDITETYDLRRGESRSLRSRIEGFFDEFPTLSLPVAQALAEVYCKASPQDGESFLTALACSKYTVRDGEFSQTGKRMLAAIQAAGIEQPYFSGTPPTLTEAGERLADETLKKRICEIAEGSTYDLFDFLIEQHYLGDLSNHQELLEEQLLLCAEKLDEQGQLVALPFGRNPLSRRFLGVRSRLSSTLAVLCQRGYVGSDISTRWPIQSDGELLKRCSYAELTMEYGDVRLNLGGGRFNGTPSADVEDLLLATAEKKRSSEDELAELISFFSSFPAPQPFSSSISDFDSLFEQEPPEETATREVFNQVVDLLAERHTPDELRTFMFQKIRDLLGHSADSRKLAFSVAALRATGSDSSVGETARSWRDAVQKGRSFREALQSAPALKAFHQKANSIGLSERYQYGALLYLAEFGSLSAKIQSTRKKALIMAAESFQRDPSYRAREGEDPILAQMVRSLPGTAHADYQRIVIGLLEGRRKAQRQIPHGSENQGQRMYTPGDDTRRIHHKASARSDRLVIKVGSDDISFDKTHVHVEAGKLQQEENLSELLHYLTTLAQEGNAVSLSLYWGGGCIRHFSSREVREAISSLVQAEPFSVAGKSEARERFIQETGELAEKAANICETTEKEIGLRNLIPRSDTRSVLYTCETSREIRGALDSKLRHLRQRYLLSKEQLSLA